MFPNNIRSGFDILQQPDDNSSFNRLLAMTLTMIAEADQMAAKYAIHQGRSILTVADVRMSLRYQSKNFLFREDIDATVNQMEQEVRNTENPMDKWDEIICKVYDDVTIGPEDDDSDEMDEEEEIVEDENVCECEMCKSFRECDASWSEYEPQDETAMFLKMTCDATVGKFELE